MSTTPRTLTAAQYAEAVLARAYHRSTAFEMARSLRAELDACPKRAWDELRPGQTYLYQRYAGSSQETFRLIEFTPSKRQAQVVLRLPDDTETIRKIYRGTYSHATMTELSPSLISLLGVSHRDVLETAIEYDLSQDIPGTVRREEPDLFVTIPERFSTESISRTNKRGTADRLRDTLASKWGTPVSPEMIAEWLDAAHEQIAVYQEERFKAVALNPKLAQDYDRYIEDAKETIDWFRWVETLIEEEGVFYVGA